MFSIQFKSILINYLGSRYYPKINEHMLKEQARIYDKCAEIINQDSTELFLQNSVEYLKNIAENNRKIASYVSDVKERLEAYIYDMLIMMLHKCRTNKLFKYINIVCTRLKCDIMQNKMFLQIIEQCIKTSNIESPLLKNSFDINHLLQRSTDTLYNVNQISKLTEDINNSVLFNSGSNNLVFNAAQNNVISQNEISQNNIQVQNIHFKFGDTDNNILEIPAGFLTIGEKNKYLINKGFEVACTFPILNGYNVIFTLSFFDIRVVDELLEDKLINIFISQDSADYAKKMVDYYNNQYIIIAPYGTVIYTGNECYIAKIYDKSKWSIFGNVDNLISSNKLSDVLDKNNRDKLISNPKIEDSQW